MTSSTGDLISLAAANTTLAAGSGGIAALLCDLLRRMRSNPSEGYFDLQAAMNGCLAGLVAVTAGCTAIEPWAAVLVGIIAGIIFVYGIRLLQANRIDDAVDAIPVHLFCGIWGAISVGLVASPDRMHLLHPNTNHIGLLYSFGRGNCDATLLGVQVLGLSLIVCWVSLFMLPFSLWLDYLGCLRCNPLEEIAGIDSLKHGERRNSIEVKPVNNPINVQDYEEFKNRRQMKNEDILRKRAIIQRAITSRLSSFSAEGSLRSKMSDASDKSQSKTVSESSKHNSS